MCHHTGGLVYDNEVIVFEEDFKRYVLRERFRWGRPGERDLYDIVRHHGVTRPYLSPVHENGTTADCLLYLVPGRVFHVAGDIDVQPLFLFSRGDDELDDV